MPATPQALFSFLAHYPCLAMHEPSLAALLARFESLEKTRQLDGEPRRDNPFSRTSHKYTVKDGTAVMDLVGIILPDTELLYDYYGIDYTVTGHFTDAIIRANNDSSVKAILINADSPGGVVYGLQGAYEAIRDSAKPVVVSVHGLLASAAYYIAAAADKIIADPAAIVGSIGTMTTVTDTSALAEKIGIKVHLIASGAQKGTGTPGTPITSDRLRPYQELVNDLSAQFKTAVAQGRGMTSAEIDAIATGEAWAAPRAVTNKLIDATSTNLVATATAAMKEFLMLTKEQYKALIAVHAAHIALIDKMDAEGADEAAIKAAIVEAEHKADKTTITELQNKISAHETELKAEKEAHEKTKTELVKAQEDMAKMKNFTPQHEDPGQGTVNTAPEVTEDEFNAKTPHEKALFFANGGKVVTKK